MPACPSSFVTPRGDIVSKSFTYAFTDTVTVTFTARPCRSARKVQVVATLVGTYPCNVVHPYVALWIRIQVGRLCLDPQSSCTRVFALA